MTTLHRLKSFIRNERGNVALLTAMLILPLAGVGGLAVDHMTAVSAKTRFDAAADAAALAAVKTATAVATGETNWGSGDPVQAGTEAALRVFNANARSAGATAVPQPTITLTAVPGSAEYSSVVTWTSSSPATFGGLFGIGHHQIAGRADARASKPAYSDFHIVMDMSMSMLIGATSADVLATYNELGCAFACHVPSAIYRTDRATLLQLRANTNVRLRVDVMKDAIVAAIEEMRRRQTIAGQYRIALHGFSNEMKTFMDISDPRSSDYDAVIAAVRAADVWHTIGGGTGLSNMFPWLRTKLRSGGDGSAGNPFQRVILITDGIQDSIKFASNGDFLYESMHVIAPQNGFLSVMDPAVCSPIKQIGAELAVVLVEYVVPTRVPGVWVAPNETVYFNYIADTLFPVMTQRMTSCASSPSHFAHANTPSEIYQAIKGAFSGPRGLALTR
ncbi:MAG: vWA domain-containing protein [Beijerinckiaceae bacterium]